MEILKEYELDGYKIIEYTKDGETIHYSTKEIICEDGGSEGPVEQSLLTNEEIQSQILLNTEYLVTITQLNNI